MIIPLATVIAGAYMATSGLVWFGGALIVGGLAVNVAVGRKESRQPDEEEED